MNNEPGRELDRLIHEHLGLPFRRGVVAIWDKDCKRIYPEEYYYDDDQGHGKLIPAYSTDLNAATSLPIPAEHAWILERSGDQFRASLTIYEDGMDGYAFHTLTEYTSSRGYAGAICIAWLLWKDG